MEKNFMQEVFNELKEEALKRFSKKIGEISKRHGGELTKQDINDLEYYTKLYKYIENI